MSAPPLLSPEKFASTITLGPKGQIVIPKAARDLVGLRPGDSALLLADADQGVTIAHQDLIQDLMARALGGHSRPPAPPRPEEEP
ncbi:AbrB/MazE/SpoVT family DNA-binding domain-containing protein [Actinomyces oricola]|uniref:AbrB/MazE/SpoVT family DNA-binding domain-containing protein n=1 Tax=Actinomyces oricola TaxID=206043 RepID=UPI000FFE49B0|nr:AbrB/MazE/SpoVT family DNA-binding domain-containing protein [Actinomyces oricola]